MLIFGSEVRSYRDLPMRIHEQSVLHRNEASGVLSGLTRVREFMGERLGGTDSWRRECFTGSHRGSGNARSIRQVPPICTSGSGRSAS